LVQNVETTRSLTDTSEGKYLVKTKSALQSSVWLTAERPFDVAQDSPSAESKGLDPGNTPNSCELWASVVNISLQESRTINQVI
jgi:hypothetical protein